jgi:hypothetical protein
MGWLFFELIDSFAKPGLEGLLQFLLSCALLAGFPGLPSLVERSVVAGQTLGMRLGRHKVYQEAFGARMSLVGVAKVEAA